MRSGIPDVAREQAWALLGCYFCISRARTACEYRVNFPVALPGCWAGCRLSNTAGDRAGNVSGDTLTRLKHSPRVVSGEWRFGAQMAAKKHWFFTQNTSQELT